MMKFLESYSEIKNKCDDDDDVKINLAEIFTKFNKIQNLNPNVKETLENAEKKIMKGEKLTIKNNNSKKSSRNNSRGNSKNESRSGSPLKKLNIKRTHKQMEAIDEQDEIIEERKKSKSKGKISKKNIKKNKGKKKNESESDNDFDDEYSDYSDE